MFQYIQKLKKSKRSIILLSCTAGVIIAAIAITFIAIPGQHGNKVDAAGPTKKAPASMFTFDASKATEWHLGPTNQTSIALFFNKGDCFTSIGYNPGQVDDTAQNTQAIATMKGQGNADVTVTNQSLVLHANTGDIPYTLHLYSSTSGQSSYYQYQEAAYVNETGHYYSITGYCKVGSNLTATIDALNAISVKL
jgi:hypothetical protein